MLPKGHHGNWTGENRLWLEPDKGPDRSEGAAQVDADGVTYTWSFQDKAHMGKLVLLGPAGAVRGEFSDSFHAEEGMVLNGRYAHGVLKLFGTYSVGDTPPWGWTIELDVRDPEHFVMRMFNVAPDGTVYPAVHLQGAREER